MGRLEQDGRSTFSARSQKVCLTFEYTKNKKKPKLAITETNLNRIQSGILQGLEWPDLRTTDVHDTTHVLC